MRRKPGLQRVPPRDAWFNAASLRQRVSLTLPSAIFDRSSPAGTLRRATLLRRRKQQRRIGYYATSSLVEVVRSGGAGEPGVSEQVARPSTSSAAAADVIADLSSSARLSCAARSSSRYRPAPRPAPAADGGARPLLCRRNDSNSALRQHALLVLVGRGRACFCRQHPPARPPPPPPRGSEEDNDEEERGRRCFIIILLLHEVIAILLLAAATITTSSQHHQQELLESDSCPKVRAALKRAAPEPLLLHLRENEIRTPRAQPGPVP